MAKRDTAQQVNKNKYKIKVNKVKTKKPIFLQKKPWMFLQPW